MFVAVKLMGGIGSQMLQYATARSLAIKHNYKVILDLSLLNDKERTDITIRNFELDYFPVAARVASLSEMKRIDAYKNNWLARAYNKLTKVLGLKPVFIFLGEGGDFRDASDNLAKAPEANMLYLDGYWFNEKYFVDIKNQLKQDFAFHLFVEPRNKQASNLINQVCAVSLHVRRGDYIKYSMHGVCDLEYYKKAVSYIENAVPRKISFFVFSDDIEWVKENIPLPNEPTYIDWNTGAKSVEDIHLMSLCNHNIIANSSFSWWGAWLNSSADKIVVCPKIWHSLPAISSEVVVPNSWIKI